MFSLPVPRRNLRFQEISSVFRLLQSLRRARLTRSGGFEPERQPSRGHVSAPGTVFDTAQPSIGPLGALMHDLPARRTLRQAGASSDLPGGTFAALVFRRADA